MLPFIAMTRSCLGKNLTNWDRKEMVKPWKYRIKRPSDVISIFKPVNQVKKKSWLTQLEKEGYTRSAAIRCHAWLDIINGWLAFKVPSFVEFQALKNNVVKWKVYRNSNEIWQRVWSWFQWRSGWLAFKVPYFAWFYVGKYFFSKSY